MPLEQHVLVKSKLLELFDGGMGEPGTGAHRVNPELARTGGVGGPAARHLPRAAPGPLPAQGRGQPRPDGALRARAPARVASTCCRRSSSSSAGSAATPPSARCCAATCGSPRSGSATRSGRSSRSAAGRSPTRTSACSATGAGSRGSSAASPPTTPGMLPDLQGGRRGALPAQAAQGRVRDRDPRARRQHARPHRRAREAREVQRRGPRADHAGGVHAADRPRRASRHRRRGALRHPVGRRARPAGRRLARVPPQLPARSRASARPTTWPST